MSLESAIATRNSLITEIGKNALNIKYPKEFELYVIALELTDEALNTLRYFVFPVNPKSIEEIKSNITNVQRTVGGISVLKTPTFTPVDITLTGTFGRSFKILLGATYEDFVHSFTELSTYEGLVTGRKVTDSSFKSGLKQTFDDRIKTGYGCLKILEEIIDESQQLGGDGQQRRLIFHNPAFGNSYLVEAGALRVSENEQSNIMKEYSLRLKAVAPLESLMSTKDRQSVSKQLNITNYIQKRTNSLLNNISKIAAKGVEAIPQS